MTHLSLLRNVVQRTGIEMHSFFVNSPHVKVIIVVFSWAGGSAAAGKKEAQRVYHDLHDSPEKMTAISVGV